MARRVFSSIAVALLLTAQSFAADQPKAVAQPTAIDFGSYQANESKRAEFKILNAGASELRILRIGRTCGCAEVSIAAMAVPPGASVTAHVEMRPESISGPFAKNVFLETNDPACKLLQIQVSGNAVPLYEIKPKDSIDLGRLKDGEKRRLSFNIYPTGGTHIELEDPKLESTHKSSAKLAKAADSSWILDLEVEAEPAKGDIKLKAVLPIKSPQGWKSPEILVTGRAGLEIAATPTNANAMLLQNGDAIVRFEVRVLGASGPAIASMKVSSPEGVVPGMELDDSGKIRLSIKLDSVALNKLHEDGAITLHVDYPGSSNSLLLTILPPLKGKN